MRLIQQNAYLERTRPWVQFPVPHKPGLRIDAYNPSTCEVGAGDPEVQSQPGKRETLSKREGRLGRRGEEEPDEIKD